MDRTATFISRDKRDMSARPSSWIFISSMSSIREAMSKLFADTDGKWERSWATNTGRLQPISWQRPIMSSTSDCFFLGPWRLIYRGNMRFAFRIYQLLSALNHSFPVEVHAKLN